MFLQHGASMTEDVNAVSERAVSGVISHGVTTNAPLDLIPTGFAATSIRHKPRNVAPMAGIAGPSLPPQASYLLQALPLGPHFNCRSYGWPDSFAVQLEKIATNAFCNLLCALADSPNKYLFTIPEMWKSLMSEISSVILALPEIKSVPSVAERVSPAAIESTVASIIDRTRETRCLMVWDLRSMRQTEV